MSTADWLLNYFLIIIYSNIICFEFMVIYTESLLHISVSTNSNNSFFSPLFLGNILCRTLNANEGKIVENTLCDE